MRGGQRRAVTPAAVIRKTCGVSLREEHLSLKVRRLEVVSDLELNGVGRRRVGVYVAPKTTRPDFAVTVSGQHLDTGVPGPYL